MQFHLSSTRAHIRDILARATADYIARGNAITVCEPTRAVRTYRPGAPAPAIHALARG